MRQAVLLLLLCVGLSGCTFNVLNDLMGTRSPLRQSVLIEGGRDKIVVLNINGVITDEPITSMIASSASMLETVTAQLRLAASDNRVKALVVKINSPGGGVSPTDLLWHELDKFRQKTGVPVVVSMMDMAASGGYYLATASDYIFAAPSTITGSIGVIVAYPNLEGLMDKLGVKMQVYKSGENKDLISIFRGPSASDSEIVNTIVRENAENFWGLVQRSRKLDNRAMRQIRTARIFTAKQALKIGLIDAIGYPDDAIAKAAELAKIKSPTVVSYRQRSFPNDNIYNTRMSADGSGTMPLLDFGALQSFSLKPGIYYLWMAGE